MKNDSISPQRGKIHPISPSWLRRVLKIAGICLSSAVAAIVLLLVSVTLWLTPECLTELINKEASGYLLADVKVEDAKFTLWSSFPHFFFECGKTTVVSRTLKGTNDNVRNRLPENADSLLSFTDFKGSINLLDLMRGRITLGNVCVGGLRLNMVECNDSMNNWDILPVHPHEFPSVPHIEARNIELVKPKPITFYSLSSQAHVCADITRASIKEITKAKHPKNSYNLTFAGSVSAKVKDLEILNSFPFRFAGEMQMQFHPLRTRFIDYAIDLGKIRGRLNLDMNLGKEPAVNKMNYSLPALKISDLLEYLPASVIPELSGLKTNLQLCVSACFPNGYKLTEASLPDISVDFTVPQGSVEYFGAVAGYAFDNVGLSGEFFFNGKAPSLSYVDVAKLTTSCRGLDLAAKARITDLLNTPHVDASFLCEGSVGGTVNMVGKGFGIPLKGDGKLRLRAHTDFKLASGPAAGVSDFKLQTVADIRDLAFTLPGLGFRGNAGNGKIELIVDAPQLSNDHFAAKEGRMNVELNNTGIGYGRHYMSWEELAVKGNLQNVGNKISQALFAGSDLEFAVRQLKARSDSQDMSLSVGSAIGRIRKGSRGLDGGIKATRIDLSNGKSNVRIENPIVSLKVLPSHKNILSAPANPADNDEDAFLLPRVGHTPAYLNVNLPVTVREFLRNYTFRTNVTTPMVTLSNPALNTPAKLSGLDLTVTEDVMNLKRVTMRVEETGLTASGDISGLRAFLTSGRPTPLDINLEVGLDTVNINGLARAYEASLMRRTGSVASLTAPKPATVAPEDTLAMLIPRNLRANIMLRAKETRYSDLYLYNLASLLKVSDGNANVEHLTVNSDFGDAYMDFSYKSGNVGALGVKADVGLESINVVKFFERFHTLLEMMPEMHNLSGFVGVGIKGNMGIYPSMYVDVPSLEAKLDVVGRDLKVHQSEFIRHITKMMLIHTDGDLHIKNMDVHAAVHNNLLELYPFDFEFDQYKLRMAGINNFAGDLYYHIGIEKNPLHFPFGINIVGTYSKPELRFGGAEYKIPQGEKIAEDVTTNESFNLLRELKYYGRQFIHKAAQIP